MEGHATPPDRQDFGGIGQVIGRIVEQHLAEAAAHDHADDAPEQEIVQFGGFPAPLRIGARAPAPEQDEGGKGQHVHQPIPAHGEGAEGDGDGIELGMDEHNGMPGIKCPGL